MAGLGSIKLCILGVGGNTLSGCVLAVSMNNVHYQDNCTTFDKYYPKIFQVINQRTKNDKW